MSTLNHTRSGASHAHTPSLLHRQAQSITALGPAPTARLWTIGPVHLEGFVGCGGSETTGQLGYTIWVYPRVSYLAT